MTDKRLPDIIKVKVGWHSPLDNDLVTNLHFYLQDHSWCEAVRFAQIEDLYYSIKTCTLEENLDKNNEIIVPFPTFIFERFDEIRDFLQCGQDTFDLGTAGILQQYGKSIEAWVCCILNHLHIIDRESQRLCKQLFFKSLVRVSVYDLLYDTLRYRSDDKNSVDLVKPPEVEQPIVTEAVVAKEPVVESQKKRRFSMQQLFFKGKNNNNTNTTNDNTMTNQIPTKEGDEQGIDRLDQESYDKLQEKIKVSDKPPSLLVPPPTPTSILRRDSSVS